MPIIAANGVLVLLPSAFYLAWLSSQGEFGLLFFSIQAVELVRGAVNLALMSLNLRDGLRLAGRLA